MGIIQNLQQFTAVYRLQIIRIFQGFEIAFVLTIFVVSIAALFRSSLLLQLFLIAPSLGEIGACLLTITLMPGILGRLGIFPMVRVILKLFRRHLGISTYLFVASHSLFAYWLPSFTYGFSPLRLFQVFGILALTMATPLILTSNDYSVRVLQQWWKRIHKLVYLMLIFALLHTILVRVNTISVMLACVATLEVISFLVQYRRDHATPRG